MDVVMCRSCGEFLPADEAAGTWVINHNECPECGGQEFKHSDSGTIIQTDE